VRAARAEAQPTGQVSTEAVVQLLREGGEALEAIGRAMPLPAMIDLLPKVTGKDPAAPEPAQHRP